MSQVFFLIYEYLISWLLFFLSIFGFKTGFNQIMWKSDCVNIRDKWRSLSSQHTKKGVRLDQTSLFTRRSMLTVLLRGLVNDYYKVIIVLERGRVRTNYADMSKNEFSKLK